jgi:hypothetical protein
LNDNNSKKLPLWLADFIMTHHPESLLHTYLSFCLFDEAFEVAMKILAQQRNDNSNSMLLPLNFLDKLLLSDLSSIKKSKLRSVLNNI